MGYGVDGTEKPESLPRQLGCTLKENRTQVNETAGTGQQNVGAVVGAGSVLGSIVAALMLLSVRFL